MAPLRQKAPESVSIVEPFLLASSLVAVMAQRLVRRICPNCKEPYEIDPTLLKKFVKSSLLKNKVTYHGVGCDECMQTGLLGRVGIFELLRITDELRLVISGKPTIDDILKAAPSDHLTLREDGIQKMLAGEIILEEVLRVTQE